MGGDADSHGSITGQLAGALYGYSSVNGQFIDWLTQWDDNDFAVRAVLLHHLGSTMHSSEPQQKQSSKSRREASHGKLPSAAHCRRNDVRREQPCNEPTRGISSESLTGSPKAQNPRCSSKVSSGFFGRSCFRLMPL